MIHSDLEKYITSLINTINVDASSYSNDFRVSVKEDKILISFNSPTSFTLDEDLYFKIFKILNVPLFPLISLTPQESMIVEEFPNGNFSNLRCFCYPFRKGVPKRQVYNSLRDFENSIVSNDWYIMSDLKINLEDVTSIGIASTSGGGKSYLIYLFLVYFKKLGAEIIVVDGKKDFPARFAVENGLKLILNDPYKSEDIVLSEVCEELNSLVKEIRRRQDLIFKGDLSEKDLKPIVLVFDEIGAISNIASKNVKENFFKLITRVATLGRQVKCHLLLSNQRLDSTILPTICRDQINVAIQLGSLGSQHTQYLFPDFKDFYFLVPHDDVGLKGRGIISINGVVNTFLVPTVKGGFFNG